MIIHPPYLCKYKPLPAKLETDDECLMLQRALDVVRNHQIYMSSYDALNDPHEAAAVYIMLATMGAGYLASVGPLHPAVKDKLNEFKILSLSTTAKSTAMWAHYANNSCGICYVFEVRKTFSSVQPVIYTKNKILFDERHFPPNVGDYDPFEDIVKDSLLFKTSDWSYECEWRLITQTADSYIEFDADELVGVLVGRQVPDCILNPIQDVCNEANITCAKQAVDAEPSVMNFYPANLTVNEIRDLQYAPIHERKSVWGSAYPYFLDFLS